MQNKNYSPENIFFVCAELEWQKRETQCKPSFAQEIHCVFLDKLLILQLKVSLSFFFSEKSALKKPLKINKVNKNIIDTQT